MEIEEEYCFYAKDIYDHENKDRLLRLFKVDVIEWIKENTSAHEFIGSGSNISPTLAYTGVKFINADDAMAFKLRWG